jgi:hypothetical protein
VFIPLLIVLLRLGAFINLIPKPSTQGGRAARNVLKSGEPVAIRIEIGL